MKKNIILILLMTTSFLWGYSWEHILETHENTNDIYVSSWDSSIYLATNAGIWVVGDGLFNYSGLAALGVVQDDNNTFVIFGSGSYSDGLYTLDDVGEFTLVNWYLEPKLLTKGSHTNNIYFSSAKNFQINQNNEWVTPTEFYGKEVLDATESPEYQFVTTNDGYYHKLAGESGLFTHRQNMGTVENSEIDEASGLVASQQNPGVLWTHNDSGGNNFIYAMNELAQNLGTYTINGAVNRDWEDIAIGKNPTSGVAEIYLADIGDNRLTNTIKQIYVVSEPEVFPTQTLEAVELTLLHTISFTYPDNINYDAETLLFDQRSSTFYVITKRHPGAEENYDKIFSIAYSVTDEIQVATFVGNVELPLDEIVHYGATGGDISPDGNFILIKNYQNVYMWERKNLTIQDALDQPALEVPYIMEPQGEAVAWRHDGNGYFTVSEEYGDIPAVLYFYSKRGWRKSSPLPIKKSEYNSSDGLLYGIIYDEGVTDGLWRSRDNGVTWIHLEEFSYLKDIGIDYGGVVFLAFESTVIPEQWERISGYYNDMLFDFSDGLEDKIINKVVNNNVLDTDTVLICTNTGVYYLNNYQAVANENEDIAALPQVSVFPNPFKEEATIASKTEKIISVHVYNLKGQKVDSFFANNKKGTDQMVWKPLKSIPNGIYLLKIKTPEAVITSKVIKLD